MKKRVVIHIISHTHWDREWFLTAEYTREWTIPLFNSLFRIIEKEPEYKFILDGQTLIIEDYFDELKKKHKNIEKYKIKIERLVKNKNLYIGPYYMQPDWQLVSEESLIRNFLIGSKIAGTFGGVMKIGWLIDNFGQISQTVQIHKKFNIEGLFVWRGIKMNPEDINSEFIWESPDGSKLPTVYLLNSYRNAICLTKYPEIFEERIVSEVKKLIPFSIASNIILMNGYDQQIIPDNPLLYIKNIKRSDIYVKQSEPGEVINAVKNFKSKLKTIKGQLYNGRFVSVFPGTLTSRIYLKLLNDECERMLELYTERISVLSWILGSKYKKNEIESLWKLLLKNQPHDNICGVCIDDVHTTMEKSFGEMLNKANELIKGEISKISKNVNTLKRAHAKESYIVFNTSLMSTTSVIRIKPKNTTLSPIDSSGNQIPYQKNMDGNFYLLVKDIPSFGYKTIYLENLNNKLSFNIEKVKVDEDKRTIENNYYLIKINDNGSLNVYDKINKAWYRDLGVYEDMADAGDTYSYSKLLNDKVITTYRNKTEINFLEKGPVRCTIKIKIEMLIPEKLSKNRRERYKENIIMPIVSYVVVDAGSPIIKFSTWIKNTAKDHRVRILFPTDLKTTKSYAGAQFDVVEHDICTDSYNEKEIPVNAKRIFIGARETEPITSLPQRSFVDLTDNIKGFSVISRGLTEYEILKERNTIAITLFRSVGWLARNDLVGRTGDAGPLIFTPDAQCLREIKFEYSIYLHKGNWESGQVIQWATLHNSPCIVVKANLHKGILPDNKEFIKLVSTSKNLKITAVKVSEDGRYLILRSYNPSLKEANVALCFSENIKSAFYTDLYENIIKQIKDIKRNNINFKLKPKEIVTIKILFQKNQLIINDKSIAQINIVEEKLEKPDFSNYNSLPIITKEDINDENRRANDIAHKLKDALDRGKEIELRLKSVTENNKKKIEAELCEIRGKIKSYNRALLEARLSVIISKKKFNELNLKENFYKINYNELKNIYREIGTKINKARINKRTYDYLIEFYRQRIESNKHN